MLLTVGAQLPHTLGVPSTAPSHCLAVSLPQLGCKIQDEDYILLMGTTPPSIWAGAGRTNKENRVLLLRGHELCCVRLFICEEHPPPTHTAWGAAKVQNTQERWRWDSRPRQGTASGAFLDSYQRNTCS